LKFEEIGDETTASYAILSHTWFADHEEVTYQDMIRGESLEKLGYNKIKACADLACRDGYKYFWIDTCCIDKSSSAELSEAINSMYLWYKQSKVCYVYLSDVEYRRSWSHQHVDEAFRTTRWFTRGWTLQELIAPREVRFYAKDWSFIGTKQGLAPIIAGCSGIPKDVLVHTAGPSGFSVAQKMSWAANRQTKRIEDAAYSLMGLFDVNMPLLYGERDKAFVRLQEEILRSSNDQSIFAWKYRPNDAVFWRKGLLASSPRLFWDAREVQSFGNFGRSEPLVLTNAGIQVSFFILKDRVEPDGRIIYRAYLECFSGKSILDGLCIYLERVSGEPESWGSNTNSQFMRVDVKTLDVSSPSLRGKLSGRYRQLYVRQTPGFFRNRFSVSDQALFHIPDLEDLGSLNSYMTTFVIPQDFWDPQIRIFGRGVFMGKHGAVVVSATHCSLMIVFGLSSNIFGIFSWVRILEGVDDWNKTWQSWTPSGRETGSHEIYSSSLQNHRTFIYRATVAAEFSQQVALSGCFFKLKIDRETV
jgi:hypothetical protein